MTKQELAQKIKAKYPQYQNVEDNELADKIIAKYPVYQSQVTEQPKQNALQKFASNVKSKLTTRKTELGEDIKGGIKTGTFGSGMRGALRTGGAIAGSIGDVLFEGLKVLAPDKLEQGVKSTLESVTSTEPAQKVIQGISAWAERNPESAKDLEDILEIVGVIPVLKGTQVAGKVAGKAAIQTGKEIAGDAGRVLGKTLTTTGAIGEKTGKSLVSATFPPSASKARSLISYKAKTPLLKRIELASKGIEKAPITPSEVAIKYNLVGLSRSEIAARAKRTANELFENQVKPVVSGIKKKVKPKELFSQVKKEIAKTADTSKRKSLLNALESLQDDYKNVSSLSYKKLDQIKSEMAKGLPAKVWKGQDIAGELNNVRKMFSDKARQLIRKELPDNVRRIYDEYGSLLSIVEKGEKSLQRSLDVGVLGLTSEAIRRAGTPLTTIGGKAISEVGTATRKLGQRLLKGGTKLQKSGEKGSLLNIKQGMTIEDVSLKGKGEILKSSVSNFITKAYKEAPLAKTEIDTIASTLAKKYKGKVALAPLKKQEKVIFNIKNKYNGDSSRVSDIARNTIIVNQEDAPKVLRELQKNPNYFSGKFVDPKTDPLGYSGYNTKYRASNGHIAEIQINTPEMIYAKEPAESAIKQLGNKLYNQLNKQYNGTGGKGHLYYDKWAKALGDGDFKLAQNIQKNSTNYYRPFISRPKIDFTKPGSFAIFRKKDSNFMIASAENPMGTVISNKENIARTKAFRKFLDDNHISYHEQLGKYGGNAEASNLIEITNPKQRILVDKWLAKNSPQAENIIIKDGKAVRYDPRTNEAYQVDLTKYKGQLRRDDLADDFYSEIAGKKYALPLYDDTIEKTLDKNNFIKYYNN